MDIKLKHGQPFFSEHYYEGEVEGHKCWFVHHTFDNKVEIRWWERGNMVPYKLRMFSNQKPIIEEIKKKLNLPL